MSFRRVVDSLLGMIDRHRSRSVLIAATNLEYLSDGAVWRRFDDIVEFEPPDRELIRTLLSFVFKNFPVNFDLDASVTKLSGLSFADIERVALDATKTAVLKKRKAVTETDFAAALKACGKRVRPSLSRTRNSPDPCLRVIISLSGGWCARSLDANTASERLHRAISAFMARASPDSWTPPPRQPVPARNCRASIPS